MPAAPSFPEIDRIAEQIGVEFLSGEAREQVLRQRQLLGYDYVRLLSADAHPLSIEERKAKEAGLVVLKCQCTLNIRFQLNRNNTLYASP